MTNINYLPMERLTALYPPFCPSAEIVELDMDKYKLQCLRVGPWTQINSHIHESEWEVQLQEDDKEAFVCLAGEEHCIINNCSSMYTFFVIKGEDVDRKVKFEDFKFFFEQLGYTIYHSSFINA